MKRITLLLPFIFFSFLSFGQIIKIDSTTHWRKAFKAGINLNQASFSNWKAGGINSVGFNTSLNYKANYNKGVHTWKNEFDFLFGIVNLENLGLRKSLDRIFIDTNYGRKLNTKWDYALALNFQSQFARGFVYGDGNTTPDVLVSSFLAPAYMTMSLGFDYHPNKFFRARLSPLAPRMTIVRDGQRFVTAANGTPFGVNPDKTTRIDWFGAQILAEFNKDIFKNVNLNTRYLIYGNYEELTLKTLIHRVDLALVAKVNKFVNVSVNMIYLYDHTQFPDQDYKHTRQFSQTLTLGFLYTFQNYQDKK